jgi:type I restriction enzyme S subunit
MTDIKTLMPGYDAYKDSGVEWIGEIPEHWDVKRLKYIGFLYAGLAGKKGDDFSRIEKKELSPFLPFTSISNSSVVTNYFQYVYVSKFERQNEVKGKDILFLMSSETIEDIAKCSIYFGDKNPVYLNSFCKGYRVTNSGISPIFLNYLYQSGYYRLYFSKVARGFTRINLKQEHLYNSLVIVPTLNEQITIATFLDCKTTKIDQTVAIKEKQIRLLKERKQILIHNAVTKGLDPDVPMRDSGMEWIGKIPESWLVKRLKYILDERKERSKHGQEPLFMVSQTHGLVTRTGNHEKEEAAQTKIGNKIVYENDLVFNKLKAHLGVFFKSSINFKGLVSPDYAVYKSKSLIHDLKYLEHLFRHPAYIGIFIIRATGIVEGLIRLYTDDLFEIQIPVPPRNEQERILSHIQIQSAKIDKAVAIQEQMIEKLKEYKATLINSAVTGKIKVPQTEEAKPVA